MCLRTRWETAARKALPEHNVAAAQEQSYRDGISFAAKFIEGKGQQELVRMVKTAAESS